MTAATKMPEPFFPVAVAREPHDGSYIYMPGLWGQEIGQRNLIHRFMSKEKSENIYLGSGEKEFYGVRLDKLEGVHPDVVADLDGDLPLEDNTFSYMWTYMTFEHVSNFLRMGEELWRIAKPGCKLEIMVPWWSSFRTWGDPTHVRSFNQQTFVFWSKEQYEIQSQTGSPMGMYRPNCDWKAVHQAVFVNDCLRGKPAEEVNWHTCHSVNTIDAYWLILEAVKP